MRVPVELLFLELRVLGEALAVLSGDLPLDRDEGFFDKGAEVERLPDVEERVGDRLVREDALREVRNSVLEILDLAGELG